MEWYWWVLIGVGVVGIVILKIKVGGAWLKKQKEKKEQREKMMEDDN
ncbi:MAG: hypothetical protein JW780_04030 [Clostridiales bacterium]|nr:hypothetical protein [Clostridiales bacterium]